MTFWRRSNVLENNSRSTGALIGPRDVFLRNRQPAVDRALVTFRTTHLAVRQRYTQQLIFAPAPVRPRVKVTRYAAVSTELPGATRLALSVPSTLHTARVDEQPRMVALSVPEAIDLPSTSVRVSALAVVRGIKFRPAASDVTTIVHVRFELS